MKTKCILLLALASSTNILTAAPPAVQLKKAPITSGQSFRPAVSMPAKLVQPPRTTVQSVRPSLPVLKPAAPVFKPSFTVPVAPAARSLPKPASSPSSLLSRGSQRSVTMTPRDLTPSPRKPAIPSCADAAMSPMELLRERASAASNQAVPRAVLVPSAPSGVVNRPAPAVGNRTPGIKSTPLPGGLNGRDLDGLREGLEVANNLKEIDAIRNALPEGLRQFGVTGNSPQGPGKPNLDIGAIAGSGFAGRDIRNPLDRSSNSGAGLTDLRGAQSGSTKGQRSDSSVDRARGRDMSTTGLDLVRGGSRSGDHVSFGRIGRTDGTSDLVGVRTTPHNNGDSRPSAVSVSEHHDSTGAITGYTENRHYDGANGSYTDETVHRDANGDAQDVVVVEHNGQTGTDTKTVYNPDGSVRSGTQGCGRNPGEGGNLGGPVNGTGPSVNDVSGLVPLDLLRQFGEGQQTGGGGNRMTSGSLNANQVCRPLGGNGNAPSRRPSGLGSGLEGGGGVGGDDRPN